MKIFINIIVILNLFFSKSYSQTINNPNYSSLGTFHVKESTNPMWWNGIIFPKMNALTTDARIYRGMLAFYNTSSKKDKGLYFYDRTLWRPLISSNMLSKDISTVTASVVDEFKNLNSDVTQNITIQSVNTPVRLKFFDITNNSVGPDEEKIFEMAPLGNITILRTGKYYFKLNSSFKVDAKSEVPSGTGDGTYRNGIILRAYGGIANSGSTLGIASGASNADFFGHVGNPSTNSNNIVTTYRSSQFSMAFGGFFTVSQVPYILEIRGNYQRLETTTSFTEYTMKPISSSSTITIMRLTNE